MVTISQQAEQQEKLNVAYRELNNYLRYHGGSYIHYDSSFHSVADAFRNAGMTEKQAKQLYEKTVTEGGSYSSAMLYPQVFNTAYFKELPVTMQTETGPISTTIKDARVNYGSGITSYKQTPSEIKSEFYGKITPQQQSVMSPEVINKPLSTLSSYNKPSGFLPGLQFNIQEQTAKLRAQEERGKGEVFGKTKLFGLGVASSLTSAAIGTKELIFHPIKTTQNFPSFISSLPSKGKEFGARLKSTPTFAFGEVTGTYLSFKAPDIAVKGIVKGSDIIRTVGLKELPQEKIIAPEYFKGQKYPKIKKRETAGELLREFKPIKELNEKKPAGFTASPKPFKKETTAGAGSSELQGVYQAPKVSPAFLKVSSENKKVFSFNPFGTTLRPSIIRITPTKYKLIPQISNKISNPIKLTKDIKSFFKFSAEKGTSYIPFIKTEKEAIISLGTKLERTNKKFYIKFEGRRIPIYQMKATKGGSNLNKISKEMKDVISSSRRKVGEESYINPSSIFKISSSYKPLISSYSRRNFLSSSNKLSSKNYTPSYKTTYKPYTKYGYSNSSSYKILPYSSSGGYGYTSTPYKITGGGTPNKFQKFIGGKKKTIFKPSKLKLKPPKRIPSLLALGEKIKSTKRGTLEGSGISIRPIIVKGGRRRK